MDPRDLPSVDALAGDLAGDFDLPRTLLVTVARQAIDEARVALQSGSPADPVASARQHVGVLTASRLQGVVNATGVLLHTNLGRAPTIGSDVPGFSNLEFDLERGERGRRSTYLNELIASTVGQKPPTW